MCSETRYTQPMTELAFAFLSVPAAFLLSLFGTLALLALVA